MVRGTIGYMLLATPTTLRQAAAHLADHDPVLAPVINQVGICTIQPHQDYYRALVDSILGQQLSVKAAASIRQRFLQLFDGTFPEAAALLEKSPDELRTAGLSRAKTAYIHDLARHIVSGTLSFGHFDEYPNDGIIAELTRIKGIGEWTAHMFLIFCIGRLDVLPVGDLGIRNGIRRLYRIDTVPTPRQITDVATRNRWHPYESVASWYVWQYLDAVPAEAFPD